MFKVAGLISKYMQVQSRAAFPGLNLAILAAITPPHVEVRIVDESVEPVDFDTEADLVGITAMTNMAPAAYKLADLFRQRGKKVVLGGVHVTVCPDEAQKHADAVVVGEAEPIWKELIGDLERGELKPRYRARRYPSPRPVETGSLSNSKHAGNGARMSL